MFTTNGMQNSNHDESCVCSLFCQHETTGINLENKVLHNWSQPHLTHSGQLTLTLTYGYFSGRIIVTIVPSTSSQVDLGGGAGRARHPGMARIPMPNAQSSSLVPQPSCSSNGPTDSAVSIGSVGISGPHYGTPAGGSWS